MAYNNNSLTTVKQLKNLAEKNKTEIDALTLAQEVLDSRMDTQVTATTEPDADYAAEVVDGRVDTWGKRTRQFRRKHSRRSITHFSRTPTCSRKSPSTN